MFKLVLCLRCWHRCNKKIMLLPRGIEIPHPLFLKYEGVTVPEVARYML